MARVYLAESLASGIQKLVVLKILNHELARDAAMRAAFLREAVISGRMNHPNVVQVHEVLEHRSTDVIVMEYVDGFALSRIAQEKKEFLTVRLHLSIVVQMLAGLHYFHELTDLDGHALNGVHRDVSPHNVLVSHDGPAKVADFGIAKISAPVQFATQTGLVKGKIQYMAPEQLMGDEVDRRADIFSAGVLLWEAVAERRMWLGRDARDVSRALTKGDVPRLADVAPAAPKGLVAVATRATAANPKDRYRSALEMLEEAERAMAESVGVASPREVSEFMSRAFGELRLIQGRSVNHALRHPEIAPLGMLDCWTTGHALNEQQAASARQPVQATVPGAFTDEFIDSSLSAELSLSTHAGLPMNLSGLTASGPTVLEPVPAAAPSRLRRKALFGMAGAALLLSSAAWFMPQSSPGPLRGAAAASAPLPAVGLPTSSTLEATPSEADVGSPNREDEREAAHEPELEGSLGEAVEPRPEPASRPRRARPAHAEPRKSGVDCSPPYRLLPTGVKSFKRECFPNAGGPSGNATGKAKPP